MSSEVCHLIYCAGCGQSWVDDGTEAEDNPADPRLVKCTCTPGCASYEDWHDFDVPRPAAPMPDFQNTREEST